MRRGTRIVSRGLDYGPMKVGRAKRGPAVSTGIYGKRVAGPPNSNTVKVRGRG